MRLKKGQTEYNLPIDLHTVRTVYIRANKIYTEIYPSGVDDEALKRANEYRAKRHPKESIPVTFTVYGPKRGRKKSMIVFHPAPSKNWKVDISYFVVKQS